MEDYKNNRTDLKVNKRDNLAKSLAKSAAIKAGIALDNDAIAELIDKLFACEMVNVSIYGKPIILTITLQEILSRFEQKN